MQLNINAPVGSFETLSAYEEFGLARAAPANLVEPQPTWIESSGRWCWPLPAHARFPGCCTEVLTASREWWEYAPSVAFPRGFDRAELRADGRWYWLRGRTAAEGAT